MLEIIRSGNAKWPFISASETSSSRVERKEVAEEPLLRAPGIPKVVSDSRIKPAVRAATLPAERTETRRSWKFEPVNGPSLFSGFKRSATMEESPPPVVSQPRCSSPSEEQRNLPICGNPSLDTMHLNMAWNSGSQHKPASTQESPTVVKPKCKDCTVLMQSMNRLRQIHSLNASLQPKVSSRPPKAEPVASRNPQIEQLGHLQQQRTGHLPSSQPVFRPINSKRGKEPSSCNPTTSEKEMRGNPTAAFATLPATLQAQHRALTSQMYTTQPPPLASTRSHDQFARWGTERMVSAPQDHRDFSDPRLRTQSRPPQLQTGPAAPATRSQHPADGLASAIPCAPSHTTIPFKPSQLPCDFPADPRAMPGAPPTVSHRVAHADAHRKPSVIYPTIAPPTAAHYLPPHSPSTNLPGTHRQNIRPEEAALWEQLEELRGNMERLLKRVEGGNET